MRYAALVTKEDESVLARFPDCPGCQTQADPGERIEDQALDALTGWLQVHLMDGEAPPHPSVRAPKLRRGESVLWVDVPAKLGVKLTLRWARQDAGLSQAQLAKLAGVTQPMITKLESVNYNPSVGVLEQVARALGAKLVVDFERPHRGRRAAAVTG
jgi:DNA-binding XRE family transcriptional regulator/predicted RNase H-like HicB family nuclease